MSRKHVEMESQFSLPNGVTIEDRVISTPPVVLQQPMKERSPKLLPLLEKVAIDNNVIISVFDYSFLSQFYSFYHNSIIPLGITNFIAFALDKRSYSVQFQCGLDSRFWINGISLVFYSS